MDCQTQLSMLANEEFSKGDYLMATRLLNAKIKVEPNNHEHHIERSICHYKLGNFQASLDDVNTAIQLNPSDYSMYYQKGLALTGLSKFSEAVSSFKKSIELRARQQDTKLSDIFKLLRDASSELNAARKRPGVAASAAAQQVQIGPGVHPSSLQQKDTIQDNPISNEPVDSTTDNKPSQQESIQKIATQRQKMLSTTASGSKCESELDTKSHFNLNKLNKYETNPDLGPKIDPGVYTFDIHAESESPSSMRKQPILATHATDIVQGSSCPVVKDASKYKRLRRDRERARRGTSKLCTIKSNDLEDLERACSMRYGSQSMRVIAPINGWLYSGTMSVQKGRDNIAQYAIKLDGDPSGSSYLFTRDSVLNDVIKEVRVQSVSDLRKGARICCYWSRTYKCLSTGVVTSRTFEATKSLVSVKYDNGDLSALPLEDLRLLPPDYPKYMSNCDPLFSTKNDEASSVSLSNTTPKDSCKNSSYRHHGKLDNSLVLDTIASQEVSCQDEVDVASSSDTDPSPEKKKKTADTYITRASYSMNFQDGDDEAMIPQTNETIEFLTREERDEDKLHKDEATEICIVEPRDDGLLINHSQLINNASRASSEENNFGLPLEYRPWKFEGSAKRSKRHGRFYRDSYASIRRGDEVLKIGDSAELMPRDESILPFVAKIDGLWATGRGEMRVRVRWYYRLSETGGEPYNLQDGDNALFETDHFDENDVQSIFRSVKILTWSDYSENFLGHINKPNDGPKLFYLAGYYDPVRCVKHLKSDVKESL